MLTDFEDSQKLITKLYRVGFTVDIRWWKYDIHAVWMQEIENQKQQIEALSARSSNETYDYLSPRWR